MARAEAQPFIKTPRVNTALIRHQLHQPATTVPRAPYDPLHQARSNSIVSQIAANPDPFHLSSPRALKTQPRYERKLQRGDDLTIECRHYELVIRVSRNRVKGFDVGSPDARLLRRTREGVAEQQLNDCIQVAQAGGPDFNILRAGQITLDQ